MIADAPEQGGSAGVRFAVVLWGEPSDKCRSLLDCPVFSYADVLASGHRVSSSFEPPQLSPGQLATIVYTSGTTGNPKVTLSCNAAIPPGLVLWVPGAFVVVVDVECVCFY
jgi:acyl-coenzyme A synthetase/AMP-(fatty) acid ligase